MTDDGKFCDECGVRMSLHNYVGDCESAGTKAGGPPVQLRMDATMTTDHALPHWCIRATNEGPQWHWFTGEPGSTCVDPEFTPEEAP